MPLTSMSSVRLGSVGGNVIVDLEDLALLSLRKWDDLDVGGDDPAAVTNVLIVQLTGLVRRIVPGGLRIGIVEDRVVG